VQNKKKKKREEPTSKNDCRPEYHRPRSNMAAQPLAHYDPGWPKIRQSVRSTETFHDNTFLAFYGPFNHLNLATDLRGTSSFQLPSVTLFASSSLHPANSILSHKTSTSQPAPTSTTFLLKKISTSHQHQSAEHSPWRPFLQASSQLMSRLPLPRYVSCHSAPDRR